MGPRRAKLKIQTAHVTMLHEQKYAQKNEIQIS